jgi:hypothetical protein
MMKEYKRDKRVLIPRDEFEAEAGEGLGGLSRDEAEADLLELKARMARRVARPRAVWLPAAAAVVILLVASGLLVTMLRDRTEPGAEMAFTEDTVPDTAYIAMASPVEKKETELSVPVELAGKAMKAGETGETGETRYSQPALVVKDEVAEMAVADEDIVAYELQAVEETDHVVYPVARGEMREEVVVVQAMPRLRTAAMKTRAEAPDRAAVPATEAKKNAVAAEPVAGITDNSFSEPSPAGGWDKYRDWVMANIRYPEGITPVLRQELLVSFTVRPDSTIVDMKAVRSPGDPFTQEVFRLLREGPRWVPAQAGDITAVTEVYVMFVFR